MEINRNNYQLWFIDYHDGTLSEKERVLVNQFLDDNPGLVQEFDDCGSPLLHPDISMLINKKVLKKDATALSNDQKEELLVSLMEGDLDKDQEDEISSLIKSVPGMAELNASINKTKLTPPDIVYPHKNRLKKFPLVIKRSRLLVYGLAAAASVAVLFSLGIMFFGNNPGLPVQTTAENQYSTPSANNNKVIPEVRKEEVLAEKTEEKPAVIKSEHLAAVAQHHSAIKMEEKQEIKPESQAISREVISILPVSYTSNVEVSRSNMVYSLAEMSHYQIPEERGNLSPREFFAKNFRSILLKENDPGTDRLKGYEIAGATISGVNKILGWDMKLQTENDTLGNLNYLKFTSQMVKFDHKSKNVTE